MQVVRSSADSLLKVLNDILDFSKIEAGKLDLDLHDFRLRESIGDTMKALAVRAHEKQLELAYHVAPEVPDHVKTYCAEPQDHGLQRSMDMTLLLDLCRPALENGERVTVELPIRNVHRTVGAMLSG